MSAVIGGFWMPHDPIMFVSPDAAPPEKAKKVWAAYKQCAERLAQLDPSSVIVFGCDHYMLFGTSCLPKYVIATGHVDGPLDQLPGLKRQEVNNNEALAQHIAARGDVDGFDWAVARAFTTDHSFSIPYQLVVREAEAILGRKIPTIPVYLACGVDPYLSLARSRALGKHIRQAVGSSGGDERVAVIASGGISHWVGTAESGQVNKEFDSMVLGHGESGDIDALCALSDDYILEHGGNGAMEIRTFVCAMAACGSNSGEIIEYQDIPEWVTGLGFLQLHCN